jgi:hypothetical protein
MARTTYETRILLLELLCNLTYNCSMVHRELAPIVAYLLQREY